MPTTNSTKRTPGHTSGSGKSEEQRALLRRVVLQVFKDLADPSENIRAEATEWFLTEDFPQIVISAQWVPASVWELSRKVIENSDLSQRKVIIDEIIKQFKGVEGGRY